jgi:galactokinase
MASQDRALPLSLAATVFQRVERHWFARPGGRASISGALLGQPGSLTEVRTDSWTQGTAVRLPESWKLVGVDCGVIHSDAADKYTRAGAAAIMGRVLVNRILRHEGLDERRWNGHIAHLSVVDYVEKVRDRLPTRMKGSEFLARFGEFDDSLTRIEPDTWYKVRSRTEHHIYEQVRVREFMDAAARASRKPDDGILAEAAEPIHASHWSYGQRCGLGSVETDSLVSAMRHAASPSPFVAAKICGCGSGGMMAVLMRASDQAEHALHQVLQSYQRRTGMTPKVFKLAAAGAKLTGVQRL